MEAVVESMFIYKSRPCAVRFLPGCYRCGYVGSLKGDKFYGEKVPDAIPVSCHGGITYSHQTLSGLGGSNVWWIGFDCGHCFDGYDIETAKSYFGENPEWLKTFGIMEEFYKGTNKYYGFQTLEYAENECRNIVDQIEGM